MSAMPPEQSTSGDNQPRKDDPEESHLKTAHDISQRIKTYKHRVSSHRAIPGHPCLGLKGVQGILEKEPDSSEKANPWSRVGVIDWKVQSATGGPGQQHSPSHLDFRQFNLTTDGHGDVLNGRDIFTRWGLESATQIVATDNQLWEFLDDMEGSLARVVLVEQLSCSVIGVLGSVYDIDSEFWAQHMSFRNSESWLWSTSQQQKPFFSVRWCHPVSVNTSSPPWDHEWGSQNPFIAARADSDKSPQRFQNNYLRNLECDTSREAPTRRLRTFYPFKNGKSKAPFLGPDYDNGPAGLDQCISVYFYKHTSSAIPKTTGKRHSLLCFMSYNFGC